MALRCELHGPLNALSQSPDGERVVVAGRDGVCVCVCSTGTDGSALQRRTLLHSVLKIVQLVDGTLVQGQNLRIMKKHLNFSSTDVHWHPLECMRCVCQLPASCSFSFNSSDRLVVFCPL